MSLLCLEWHFTNSLKFAWPRLYLVWQTIQQYKLTYKSVPKNKYSCSYNIQSNHWQVGNNRSHHTVYYWKWNPSFLSVSDNLHSPDMPVISAIIRNDSLLHILPARPHIFHRRSRPPATTIITSNDRNTAHKQLQACEMEQWLIPALGTRTLNIYINTWFTVLQL